MFRSRIFPLILSVFFTAAGSVPFLFFSDNSNYKWLVYPLACIQGVGIAMMMNTSTSLISDVVSEDTENSAIVYGSYSFFDKMTNGFLLYFLVKDYAYNALALKNHCICSYNCISYHSMFDLDWYHTFPGQDDKDSLKQKYKAKLRVNLMLK